MMYLNTSSYLYLTWDLGKLQIFDMNGFEELTFRMSSFKTLPLQRYSEASAWWISVWVLPVVNHHGSQVPPIPVASDRKLNGII